MAVEDDTEGGQGIVTDVTGDVVTVMTTDVVNGFDDGSNLLGPNGKAAIASISATDPAASFLWDMQLWNPIHGYPGTATIHTGRLFFSNFPNLPRVFSASAAGDIYDHSTGVNDGDGFAESLGSGAKGAIYHLVSSEDLLFMTSRGLYYQQTKDGNAITPLNIRPIPFSRMGVSEVVPVVVEEGAVFVDTVGNQIHVAILAGDVYKAWKVEPLSQFAPHLIRSPVHLGATNSGSEDPETFLYATLADGTAVVGQWERGEGKVSWRPWQTDGSFIAIHQAFGRTYALTERVVDEVTYRFRERFHSDASWIVFLPSTSAMRCRTASPGWHISKPPPAAPRSSPMVARTSRSATGTWVSTPSRPSGAKLEFGGDLDYPATGLFAQIGLPFTTRVVPWNRRSVNTQRGVREVKRTVMLFVTVQQTSLFEVEGRPFGGYFTGDDVSQEPPLRDMQVSMVLLGTDDYVDYEIVRTIPGKFRLLKIGYRVTV